MTPWQKHGDIVAEAGNVLQTVFVYINENSCCFTLIFDKLTATFRQFFVDNK